MIVDIPFAFTVRIELYTMQVLCTLTYVVSVIVNSLQENFTFVQFFLYSFTIGVPGTQCALGCIPKSGRERGNGVRMVAFCALALSAQLCTSGFSINTAGVANRMVSFCT
jgi:hypothetical protein